MGRLVSQLAHVELLTPDLDESVRFYTDTLGMEESGRDESSVYLRGWGEFLHHSLQLTRGDSVGLGHVAWRSDGPDALQTAVEQIEATGQGEGWFEDAVGHGPAYRFRDHADHLSEIFWEVERYAAPPERAPTFPNRPQRWVPRGASVRRLDHVNICCPDILKDVEFYRDNLGHRYTEYVALEDMNDYVVFASLASNTADDLSLSPDFSGAVGRMDHVALWVDQHEDLLRAADFLIESGIAIEFGPGRHGIGELSYLYVREPSGLRIELCTGGFRNYMPDWEPVRWTVKQGAYTSYRNLTPPDSLYEHFPFVSEDSDDETESDAKRATEGHFN